MLGLFNSRLKYNLENQILIFYNTINFLSEMFLSLYI